MSIVRFSFGLLLLAFAVSNLHAAQSLSQADSATASQVSSPATQAQGNVQPPAATKEKKEDDGTRSEGDHKLHLRLGTISLGAGYSHFSGPAYYPYGAYSPFGWEYATLWSPYWSPYPFFGRDYFNYGSDKGEVRLQAEPKSAEVYLDNAYAGTADHLKSMWLEPGAYDLSVSAGGREEFHKRIYVLSGKSLKITAKLADAAKPGAADESKDKP